VVGPHLRKQRFYLDRVSRVGHPKTRLPAQRPGGLPEFVFRTTRQDYAGSLPGCQPGRNQPHPAAAANDQYLLARQERRKRSGSGCHHE
jgi:hypothetical protein